MMTPFPAHVTDEELIAFINSWAVLPEDEDYQSAYNYTDHVPTMGWTPNLIRDVIKSYGDADPYQRVTYKGEPTDITQRKHVRRWPLNAEGWCDEIWYDLNIDGLMSDLTATFDLRKTDGGIMVYLNDIHVM